MAPLSGDCLESKRKYPAPWGGKGGKAALIQGSPWGIDNFHYVYYHISKGEFSYV